MGRDQLDDYDQAVIESAVQTVLEDHPDGLRGTAIRQAIHQHPSMTW